MVASTPKSHLKALKLKIDDTRDPDAGIIASRGRMRTKRCFPRSSSTKGQDATAVAPQRLANVLLWL